MCGCSWCYVQGAADDEEYWGSGLTPDLFWSHADALLACSTNAQCEALIRSLTRPPATDPPPDPLSFPPFDVPISHRCSVRVGPFNWAREQLTSADTASTDTGVIPVCVVNVSVRSLLGTDGEGRELWMPCVPSKKPKDPKQWSLVLERYLARCEGWLRRPGHVVIPVR